MDRFIHFLQSGGGKTVRLLVGTVLVVIGVIVIQGAWGSLVAVIGLLPILASLSKICLMAPLFGYTLDGRKHTTEPGW